MNTDNYRREGNDGDFAARLVVIDFFFKMVKEIMYILVGCASFNFNGRTH
jgi:hypothetical protein